MQYKDCIYKEYLPKKPYPLFQIIVQRANYRFFFTLIVLKRKHSKWFSPQCASNIKGKALKAKQEVRLYLSNDLAH